MTWVESNGIWSAEAAGIRFELIPGDDLIFPLSHMQGVAAHIALMHQHNHSDWATGTTCRMTYRRDPKPVAGIRKTKGGYQRGAK